MNRTYSFALMLLLLAAFAAQAAAQQQQQQSSSPPLPSAPPPTLYEPLTRLEALDTQIGSVVVKNYTYIGSVSGFGGIVMVTGYEFVDAQTGRKEYGIGVEVRETGRSERDARTYIDYDEIDALLRALDYISRIDKSTSLENFEAQYRTRGELTVSTFIRPNGTLQSEVAIGLFRKAAVTISLGKLVDFRKLVADARIVIDKIK
jgi:hypothetical protein